MDEKQELLLGFLKENREFFTLKELEKICNTQLGVKGMGVAKELLTVLVSEKDSVLNSHSKTRLNKNTFN